MNQTFLTSKDWADFQASIDRKVFRYETEYIVANIIKHELPLKKNYLYIPHGPILKIDSVDKESIIQSEIIKFVKFVKDLAKQNKSIYVKAEPLSDYVAKKIVKELRFKKSKKEIQPSKTIVLDLTKTHEELLREFNKTTRYEVHFGEKKNIQIKEITLDEFENIWPMFKETVKRQGFHLHPKQYYKDLLLFSGQELKIKAYASVLDNQYLSCGFFGFWQNKAYYLHSAFFYKHRLLKPMYALQWGIINLAKNLGVKTYDLWGIDANKWPGVTSFKIGFGGKIIEYPGSFDLIIRKFWYLIYKITSKIF